MERRKKLPECGCTACKNFDADGQQLLDDINSSVFLRRAFEPHLKEIAKLALLGKGCDFCGKDRQRVSFVPQIIKDFLKIEYFCEGCRWIMHRTRREAYWPICWGSTSDDELKWFLIEFILRHFKQEVHRLSPAQVAKDKAFQELLDTLRPPDEPEEIDIQIKPRWKIKPRVIDVSP